MCVHVYKHASLSILLGIHPSLITVAKILSVDYCSANLFFIGSKNKQLPKLV